jgi:hypothetical protein
MILAMAGSVLGQDAQPAAQPAADAAAAPSTAPTAVPLPSTPAGLWEDFLHYLRIARTDLAAATGKGLLDLKLKPEELLTLVEDGGARDVEVTLDRGSRLAGEAGAAAKAVLAAIEEARMSLARDGGRIRQNIDALDDGLRAQINATARLKRAGEYAAPQMLGVLLSTEDKDRVLTPYVIDAMVAIGRPVVAPLCEALPGIPAVNKQQIAEVLTRIGYPLALPYLKRELEGDKLDAVTRQVLAVAFDRLLAPTGIKPESTSAELFLMLAEDYYRRRESLYQQPGSPTQNIWSYDLKRGLSGQPVPTPIFADVMTMRASERALELNKELTASLSLWLSANFRRENNLPAGATDPTYLDRPSPHYYATLAGPRHVQSVLQRALTERDAETALDALRALSATGGSDALLVAGGESQPVVAALSFADRRVRYEAAFALATLLPRTDFGGKERVVPILAEAVRESGKLQAVVIAPDVETINATVKLVEGMGPYQAIMGNSIDAVMPLVSGAPGIDLVVVNGDAAAAEAVHRAAKANPKTAVCPVLVIATSLEIPNIGKLLGSARGVVIADVTADPAKIASAVQQAGQASQGAPVSEEQAKAYAIRAVGLIRDVAIENSQLFMAVDAKPALVLSLKDKRPEVVAASAGVLALMAGEDTQRAIADAALADGLAPELQIPLFRALARNARIAGNLLSEYQQGKLSDLMAKSSGEVADAAAEAVGSLNLPTADAVKRITGK